MDTGTAAQQAFNIVPLSDGFEVHNSEQPNKPDGLVDPLGHHIESRKSLIAMADEQTTAPITMSRGLAGLTSIAIALISGILAIWLYSISGAMSYQTVVNRVGDVEKRLDKMDTAITELQGLRLSVGAMSKDVETIKKTQDTNDVGFKEMMKNVSDIRILLAQRSIQQP